VRAKVVRVEALAADLGRWYDGVEKSKPPSQTMDLEEPSPERLDLRGVACPLNWARAKARLETMPRGARLLLIADDPRAARDIPGAAEAEGWAVLSVQATDDDRAVEIEIER